MNILKAITFFNYMINALIHEIKFYSILKQQIQLLLSSKITLQVAIISVIGHLAYFLY